MKKRLISVFALFMIFSLTLVSAIKCDPTVSLINQDPYPAIPGDYVKLVFQVNEIANPECKTITFELLEQYPIVFDPNQQRIITADSGFYQKDFNSFLIAPYKVRIDENAVDGDNPIEVRMMYGGNLGYESYQFNVNIEDSKTDFEVYIKKYDSATKKLTFEILNIGEVDVEALTIEIPQQENIEIKNAKVNIVGDLDSNDYTTADFEATPKAGEITIKIYYTDSINERRTLEKTILFEPEYFQGRVEDSNGRSAWTYIFWIVVIGGIGYYFYRRKKKKKEAKK